MRAFFTKAKRRRRQARSICKSQAQMTSSSARYIISCILYLQYEDIKKSVNFVHGFWSWWPDLNWWPHPYQGCALPPEPHQHFFGGSGGIRTPVGLHPNGFQDRLVMTASIRFQELWSNVPFYDNRLPKRFDATLPQVNLPASLFYKTRFRSSRYDRFDMLPSN